MATRKRIDWRECAAQLAARLPRARLHPATLAWAERAPGDEPWLVAFSGGADSLALLLLLWAHWPERRGRLCAVHFNHRLRGAASTADERFCRRVCDALKVRCRAGRWTVARRGASEAEARVVRQEFFAAELARSGSRALWLGHQQDDVAETMFMRLARGSGPGGLAAPRPVQSLPRHGVHLRPLLALKKTEIVAALRRVNAPWREDATNARGDFFRNRIRRDVLPAWRKAAGDRDAMAGAALARELIEEDDAALDAWLDELRPIMGDGALNLRRLAGKPRALVRRALHGWLLRNGRGAGISRQAFTALLDDLMRGRTTRHSLGTDGFAAIGKRRLKFAPAGRKICS